LVVLDIAPVRYCPKGDANWGAVKASVDAIANVELNNGECSTKRDVDKALRSTLEDPALRAFVLTNLDQDRSKEAASDGLKWKVNVDAIQDQLDTIAGFDLLPEEEALSNAVNGNADDSSSDNADDTDNNGGMQYHGDVFIVAGGSSRFVRQTHLPAISAYFPNYMLTTIRGAGHWVHAEAPEDTLALLKRYLDR